MTNNWQRALYGAALIGTFGAASSASAQASDVIITEFLSEADTGAAEFVELYNPLGQTIDIGGLVLSDEEEPGGTEGAYAFPSGTTMAPGEVIVATLSATALASNTVTPPDGVRVFEFSDSDAEPSNNLIKTTTIGLGSFSLSDTGDEIVIYGAANALLDGLGYGSRTLAGFPSLTPAAGAGVSYTRTSVANQPALATDWALTATPTPGVVPFDQPGTGCIIDPALCDAVTEVCDTTQPAPFCACAEGYIEDGDACVESCETAGCQLLTGEVCGNDGFCGCASDTNDYGNGLCVMPATIDCAEGDLSYGHLGQAGDDALPNGGCLTDDLADLADAGLSNVFAKIAEIVPDENGTGSLALAVDQTISVSGAVIAATHDDGDTSEFYIQDSAGSLTLRADLPDGATIRTGMQVAFTVTEVEVFRGERRISGITDWIVQTDGYFVGAPSASGTLVATDAGVVVHVAGTIATMSSSCGANCYDLSYNNGQTAVYRTNGDHNIGDTVEFIGPVRAFNGAVQFDATVNPAWAVVTPGAPVVCVEDSCDVGEDCSVDTDNNLLVCECSDGFEDPTNSGTCTEIPVCDPVCESEQVCEFVESVATCVAPPAPIVMQITEVMYDAPNYGDWSEPGDEWVELFNAGTETVDLSGWTLTDAADDVLPIASGTTLDAGAYLILAADAAAFADKWNAADAEIVEYDASEISLGNSGDLLRLLDAQATEYDAVGYENRTDEVFIGTSDNLVASAGESIYRVASVGSADTAYERTDWDASAHVTPGQAFDVAMDPALCGNGLRDAGEICDAGVTGEVCCNATCDGPATVEDAQECRPANAASCGADTAEFCNGAEFFVRNTDNSDTDACPNDLSVTCDAQNVCLADVCTPCGDTCDVAGNEVCVADDLDVLSCACADGFERDGDNACVVIGPVCGDLSCDEGELATCATDCSCADLTCGANESCGEDATNGPSCTCDDGFERDGSNVCVASTVSCEADSCGTNETCSVNSDAIVCTCDNGFERDGSNVCVAIVNPTCADLSCGANESCDASTVSCECDAGFERDAGQSCVAIVVAICNNDGVCDEGEDAVSCPADCEVPTSSKSDGGCSATGTAGGAFGYAAMLFALLGLGGLLRRRQDDATNAA